MITGKRTKRILLVFSFLCITCTAAFAQGAGFGDDVEDTPIDGGATLIMAASAAYGYKVLNDKKKRYET